MCCHCTVECFNADIWLFIPVWLVSIKWKWYRRILSPLFPNLTASSYYSTNRRQALDCASSAFARHVLLSFTWMKCIVTDSTLRHAQICTRLETWHQNYCACFYNGAETPQTLISSYLRHTVYLSFDIPAFLQGLLHLQVCLSIQVHGLYVADAFWIGGTEKNQVSREVLSIFDLQAHLKSLVPE